MNMPREYFGQVATTVRVGDEVVLGGIRFTVTGRRELPPDRYGNVADLTFRRGERGRKTYHGGVKVSGACYVII